MKREDVWSKSTSHRQSLASLLEGVAGTSVVIERDIQIESICFDSRKAQPDSLFVALRGSYSDGHDYLQEARKNGAIACVIDRNPHDVDVHGYRAVEVVPDAREALAVLARTFYDNPSHSLRLIGVTGTDGKTTTCFMLDHLLRQAGYRTGMITTVAIRKPDGSPTSPGRQTTPESLETQRLLADMRDLDADVVILETSSHGLETHRVDGCKFDVGVVTNITHEHLDFHGSIDAYRRAKQRLLEFVDQSRSIGGCGAAAINVDDPGARTTLTATGNLDVTRFGIAGNGEHDVEATGIEPTNTGCRFVLRSGDCECRVEMPIAGQWNVLNALAASSACFSLGLSIDDVVRGLASMPAVPGRMQQVEVGQPFRLIVDYAHTSPALAHLLTAARETTEGSVLVLFGSAGERDIEKRADMGAVAFRNADYLMITSEDPRFEDPDAIIRAIADGAVRAGAVEGVDFDRLEDRRQAIGQIVQRARPGDTVILAGKGHEQSIIYDAEARPWDEVAVALEALHSLGYSTSP